MLPQIGVIGSGYWGKNLVRNFHDLGVLKYVCDERPEVLSEAREKYGVQTCTSIDTLLEDPDLQGVAIAAPASQHFTIAKRCMLAGKDVFVEKPLALSVKEGQELLALAERRHRVLMVGHLLQYHPAILKLRDLIGAGDLGCLQYIYSSRLNWGKVRTEENILWSFAPHDISAIIYLLSEMPVDITATGGSYINPKVHDTTLTALSFQSGVKAHIFVSWLHPFKEQRLVIVGTRMTAVFDDVEKEQKLVLYPHHIDWVNRVPVACKDAGQWIPLPADEPLRKECEHYIECIVTRRTPRTDGNNGVNVLRVLDACEQSLHHDGATVQVNPRSPGFTADPTSVIDKGCEIGEGSKIWHFSHVMSGSKIGRNCNVGQNVVISPGVTIGDRCKVQNNVSIYTGVELEEDVFCGPSMVFTNVINPRSHVERKHEFKRTLVRRGATIGANSTIVCGITLGQYSFVAAGAVVTRNVPDFALVMGVPAVQVGWMCVCGERLTTQERVSCSKCDRAYAIADDGCRELDQPSVLSDASASAA